MARVLPDITPELQALIDAIGKRSTYGRRPVSPRIMRQIVIETRQDGAGVLAPFWLGVLQYGRGPRKGKKSSDLWKSIYTWMAKNGMFKSTTAKGKINEAKGVTWYINKYGNQQFRSKAYIDIYDTERKKCIADVFKKYDRLSTQVTRQIL